MSEIRELKRLIRKHPAQASRMAIRGPAIELYRWISAQNRQVTSSEVSKKFGISVQSASARLERLYRKGYLDSSETASLSGGIEFEYFPIRD